MTREACIVGVGASGYYKRGRSLPLTGLQLLGTAIRAALADAGLSITDVDGITGYAGGLDNALLAHSLGIPEVRFVAALTGGGGGAAGSVGLAAMAVSAGHADVVVTANVMQQAAYRLGRTAVGPGASGPYAAQATPDKDFTYPYGLLGVGSKFAMVAQRHMYRYGTTREHFAEVAISTRNNALSRPTALMKKPMTLDDYFSARMISDPMCLYDYCLESDGAVAIVTTSAERAADLRRDPVRIVGSAMGGAGRYGHSVGWMNSPEDYFASAFHKAVADRLYGRARLGPADIDVALMYDHFTPMVLLQLEDYGFCARGESGPFVAAGNIRWPHGKLPLNTHGGNLSEAYIMGLTHVKEAVEQLRGTAVNQVPGARTALVTGGPAAVPVSALILGRD
jgi:acetyl-CoA acetyltransferase